MFDNFTRVRWTGFCTLGNSGGYLWTLSNNGDCMIHRYAEFLPCVKERTNQPLERLRSVMWVNFTKFGTHDTVSSEVEPVMMTHYAHKGQFGVVLNPKLLVCFIPRWAHEPRGYGFQVWLTRSPWGSAAGGRFVIGVLNKPRSIV